jgi:4-diphosphocytidyl-2C-methyl-D-erythritol kinase
MLALIERHAQLCSPVQLANALRNDLMKAARSLAAEVDELPHRLKEVGALGASMSGSGSACFGLFATRTEAERAAGDFVPQPPPVWANGLWMEIAAFCDRGFEIRD